MKKDKMLCLRISRTLDINIRINIPNTMFKEVDRFIWKGKIILKGKLMETSREYQIVLNCVKL
jgi:hypothetical protein